VRCILGELKTDELVPGGSEIEVNESNKVEYVNRQLEHKLVTSIQPQIRAFRAGLLDLVSKESLLEMEVEEIQQVLAGSGDLDLEEWRASTKLSGVQEETQEIGYFWDVLEQDLSLDDRASLLQFVTSCRLQRLLQMLSFPNY